MSKHINYNLWLDEINKSNHEYQKLFISDQVFPPIFFFGNPDNAVAATGGVNPSATEFSSYRQWNIEDDVKQLIERCKNYFANPFGISSHPWFKTWKYFLHGIGLSYSLPPSVVHLDLSPRATHSMGSIQKESKQLEVLFLKLVENDLKYFFYQLLAYPRIRHLYVAGSITRKYYVIEFLERCSSRYNFSLIPVFPFKRGGRGKIGLYKFELEDNIMRHLFFCSTSPSARDKRNPLPKKAIWLKKFYPEFVP